MGWRGVLRLNPRCICSDVSSAYEQTASGLKFFDYVECQEGPRATDGDSISVHYTGKLADGTTFDTSIDETICEQFEFKDATDLRGVNLTKKARKTTRPIEML